MEKQNKSNGPAWWQPAVIMFTKLSAWIAAPVVIALFLGKWLDKKYNSEPWLLLICVGAAFVISVIGLVKESVAEYRKIGKMDEAEKRNGPKNNFI